MLSNSLWSAIKLFGIFETLIEKSLGVTHARKIDKNVRFRVRVSLIIFFVLNVSAAKRNNKSFDESLQRLSSAFVHFTVKSMSFINCQATIIQCKGTCSELTHSLNASIITNHRSIHWSMSSIWFWDAFRLMLKALSITMLLLVSFRFRPNKVNK